MTWSAAQRLGEPKAGSGRRGAGDRASRAREAQCAIFQPSHDKPHWALSSRRAGRRGECARGGHVWFGVWFPLLCLANSLERRRLTAPRTGDFGETR